MMGLSNKWRIRRSSFLFVFFLCISAAAVAQPLERVADIDGLRASLSDAVTAGPLVPAGTASDPFDIVTGGPGDGPVADITPASFVFEVDAGDADGDVLNIGNSGDEALIWSIEQAETAGVRGVTVLLDEDFTDETFPPAGWTVHDVDGDGKEWIRTTSSFESSPAAAFHEWDPDHQVGWLITPQLSLDPDATVTLAFAERTQFAFDYRYHGVMVSDGSCDPTDGDFVELAEIDDGNEEWRSVDLDLSGYAGDNVCIGFFYDSEDGANWFVDDVTVTVEGSDPVGCDDPTDIPWLSVDPDSGTTPATDSVPVDVTVDSDGLAEGIYEALLCVTTNDPGAALVEVPVTLEVTAPPTGPGVLEVDPLLLDFDEIEIGMPETLDFSVSNAADPGADTIEVDTIELTGDVEFAVTGGDCEAGVTALAPGESCTVEVTFTPSAEDDFTGEVEVTTVDAQSETVELTGAGIEPPPAPIADITPDAFVFDVDLGDADSDTLSIGNIGGADLDWSIELDGIESALTPRSHDPALDEALEVPDFSIDSPANGGSPAVFTLPAGVTSAGDVVGFSFVGTVSGITDNGLWASDMCMIVEAPDGTSFAVGGFSGTQPGCDVNAWDFGGSASGADGTYDSAHDDVFDPAVDGGGDWTLTFVNDWDSPSAATMHWSDVTVTLHKQPLPFCDEISAVGWLSIDQDEGTTPPTETDQVLVSADSDGLSQGTFQAALCVTTNDPDNALVVVPVTLNVTDTSLGTLAGEVTSGGYCDADPHPVADALVTVTGDSGATFEVMTDGDGGYSLEISTSENPLEITVSAGGYFDDGASGVNIVAGDTVTENFELALDAPCATVDPGSFSFDLILGDADTQALTVGNVDGAADLDWSIETAEPAGLVRPDAARAVGGDKTGLHQARPILGASDGRVALYAEDIAGMAVRGMRGTSGPTLSVDGVTTGGEYGSGHPFNTIVTLDIGVGNELTGIGWEVNIEAFDPSWLSESSVAFVTNLGDPEFVFLAPSFDDMPGSGTFSSEGIVMLADAGLDPVPANAAGQLHLEWFDDFVDFPDDAESEWSDPASGQVLPPGLRLICSDQAACDAAVAGAADGCDNPAAIPWLSVNPDSDLTPPGGSDLVDVTVTTAGLAHGSYEALLCVGSNDPFNGLISVPVTLDVTDPDAGTLEGTVSSAGYCGADPHPVADALVSITGDGGALFEVTTDGDGFYSIDLNQGESPLEITVTAGGYLDGMATGVAVSAGETTVEDFDLVLDAACATVAPDSLEASAAQGGSTTRALTVGNQAGGAALGWNIVQAETEGMRGGPVDLIEDGSFEAGTPNPSWQEGSTNFGTPLCTVAACDDGGGTGPNTGTWWAWFGGAQSLETGFVAQDVTLPAGGQAELRFWLEIPAADVAGFLDVSLGGDVLFSVTEADAATYATYTEVVVDVSAYADGGTHALRFDSTIQGTQQAVTNFFVDDVSLLYEAPLAGCAVPTDIPWLSADPDAGTTPAGETSEVQVQFDATGLAVGDYEALLCVNSDDANNPLIEVPVTLTVLDLEPGELEVTPSPLQFGEVMEGASSTLSLTVTNAGEVGEVADLLVTKVNVPVPGADHAFAWVGGTCKPGVTSLAAGETCTVDISFMPVAPASYSGLVTIDADFGAQIESVELFGTGVEDPTGGEIFSDRFESELEP